MKSTRRTVWRTVVRDERLAGTTDKLLRLGAAARTEGAQLT